MKTLLLIVGIVCIVAGALALIFAVFNLMGYYTLLDGSAELYARLHSRMILFFAMGAVLAAAGVAGLIVRSKL